MFHLVFTCVPNAAAQGCFGGIVCNILLFFFLYDREATDSYSISAAPNLESIIRAPSVIYSSFIGGGGFGSKSYLEHDERTSFLSGEELTNRGISRRQSTWWEKASIQMQIPEELPVGYGCSLTQTIFNGMVLQEWIILKRLILLFHFNKSVISVSIYS